MRKVDDPANLIWLKSRAEELDWCAQNTGPVPGRDDEGELYMYLAQQYRNLLAYCEEPQRWPLDFNVEIFRNDDGSIRLFPVSGMPGWEGAPSADSETVIIRAKVGVSGPVPLPSGKFQTALEVARWMLDDLPSLEKQFTEYAKRETADLYCQGRHLEASYTITRTESAHPDVFDTTSSQPRDRL